jgi:hypothetical protein
MEHEPKPTRTQWRQLGLVAIGIGIGGIGVAVALILMGKSQQPWIPFVAGLLLVALGAWLLRGAGMLLPAYTDEVRDRPKMEDLEEAFGPDADQLTPPDADFTKQGKAGPDQSGKDIGFGDPDLYGKLYGSQPQGRQTLRRLEKRPAVRCNTVWYLCSVTFFNAPGCQNVPYGALFREALLLTIAEANRICTEESRDCPRANCELRFANWFCADGEAGVTITLKVVCVAA